MGARFASNVSHARKSFWTHTVEQLGDLGHVESRFSPFGYCVIVSLFGDSARLDARQVHGLCIATIGLKIILDTPDATPR
jgi:hypothetical protein